MTTMDYASPVNVAYRARESAMRPAAEKLVAQYARGLVTLAELTSELTLVQAQVFPGCQRCGWQYDEDTLRSAADGHTRLDQNPTHLCA